jgi:hypothetical protein
MDCHNGNNQLFELIDLEDGYIAMRARHSSKCLDVNGGLSGTALVQNNCTFSPNQQFERR